MRIPVFQRPRFGGSCLLLLADGLKAAAGEQVTRSLAAAMLVRADQISPGGIDGASLCGKSPVHGSDELGTDGAGHAGNGNNGIVLHGSLHQDLGNKKSPGPSSGGASV